MKHDPVLIRPLLIRPRGLRMLGAALAAVGLLAACSPRDRQEARKEASEAVDSVGKAADDAASGAEKALNETSQALDDRGITAKVKASLLADEQLHSLPIEVDTSNAMVTLSGAAQTADEKARAAELAAKVEGVLGVKNDIMVSAGK